MLLLGQLPGGDALTSEWRLMADKALKKHEEREGAVTAVSKAQPTEQLICMSSQKSPTTPRKSGDGQESKVKGNSTPLLETRCY